MNESVAAIRTLFLHPQPSYPIADAASVLGMDWCEVWGWIEWGELEAVETDGGFVLPWAEVASFGMELWSQEVVEEALGADAWDVIPELLRLTDLEVRIPRFEVVALERLAELDNESVSMVLARELRDLVSVHSEWLSQEVPGFSEALFWPDWPMDEPDGPCGGGSGSAATAHAKDLRGRKGVKRDDGWRTGVVIATGGERVSVSDGMVQ